MGSGHDDLDYEEEGRVQNWAKVDYIICAHSLMPQSSNNEAGTSKLQKIIGTSVRRLGGRLLAMT